MSSVGPADTPRWTQDCEIPLPMSTHRSNARHKQKAILFMGISMLVQPGFALHGGQDEEILAANVHT